MTLGLTLLGVGMLLMLAGVKGYSVRQLAVGSLTPAANQSVTSTAATS